MSTTTKGVKAKSVALLFCGGLFVLGFGGSCLPNNFWADAWGRAVASSADLVFDTFVVQPLDDALDTGE